MRKILLALFMVLMTGETFAYDFEVDGIYYAKLSDSVSVQVVSSSTRYSGTVTIPPSVVNNGKTYSVTAIGDKAFFFCTGLTSVIIPNSVTSIGEETFYNCSGLTSVTIPKSVTYIDNGAFYNCTGLTSVTIGNSVTAINSRTFEGCMALTSVTIPNSVTRIGDSAFENCRALTSVTIGNSVKAINYFAFYDCTGLTSVTIPNSVKKINDSAFYGCSGLTSLDSYITDPIVVNLGLSIFYEVPTSTCVLHVPAGTKSLYQAAKQWKDFLNIVEDLSSGIVAASSTDAIRYSVSGSTISLSGVTDGETVSFYTADGKSLGTVKASGTEVSFDTRAHHQTVIVRIGKSSTKVSM